MKFRKRSLLLAVSLLLGFLPSIPASGFDDSGETPLSIEQRSYQRYLRFSPTPDDGNRVFYTYGISATPGFVNPVPYLLNRTQRKLCPSLDSSCYQAKDQIEALGYLPLCESQNQSPCISKVWAKTTEGEWVTGNVVGYVDLTPRQADLDRNRSYHESNWPDSEVLDENKVVQWKGNSIIPASAPGALKIQFPNVPNAAGKETYIIKSVYQMNKPSTGKVTFSEFFTNIIPYVDANLSYADTSVRLLIGSKKDPNILWMGQGGATGDATKFAWSEYGRLGFAAAFTEGVKFKVELQLPDAMGGWFHGRMNDPALQLSVIDQVTNKFTVEAEPAMVPVTSAWVPILENGVFNPIAFIGEDHKNQILKTEQAGQFGATGPIWEPRPGSMDEFNRHLPMLGDKARGQASVWSVAAINYLAGAPGCLNKPGVFQGLVTTDAMVYQAGIPTFSKGMLQYQVGGLHKNWKDEVIQGTYNLILRSDSARCLYGFSKAPISATISVLNDSGENITSTTVVSEKDGWLKLTAAGFTFSQKTIRVKVTQKPIKTTITCVKGKVVRKVSGVAPKCAKGFTKR